MGKMMYLLFILGIFFISDNLMYSQTYVQGNISGEWPKTGSPYIVLANVTIPGSDTLKIAPGVVVKFSLGTSMNVFGTIIAVGTESDSIKFTSAETTLSPGNWGGINFDYLDTTLSLMHYVIIEYGGGYNASGVVYGMGDVLHIDHSLIQNNNRGISIIGANEVVLSNSLIYNNSIYGFVGRYMVVSNVQFISNSGYYGGNAGSNTTFLNCTFHGNSPSAYILFDSNANTTFRNCVITENESGVGSCYDDDTLTVDSCVIRNNSKTGINANALYNSGILKVRHSIIANNGSEGIVNASKGSVIEQTNITGNAAGISGLLGDTSMVIRNNIITNNTNYGIQLSSGTPPSVRFNDVYNNNSDFSGFSVFCGDTTLAKNRNGINADLYGNIRRDPLFKDISKLDFSLQSASPCIDAGDTLLTDNDGTISDIGTYYYNHTEAVSGSETVIPNEFRLSQNFPNPFNPSTNISFSIPSRAFVSLKIFDIRGREIATLINEDLPAGLYTKKWDANSFSSGVYFYRIKAGNFIATKKLVLVK
jgi:hypothetical protein